LVSHCFSFDWFLRWNISCQTYEVHLICLVHTYIKKNLIINYWIQIMFSVINQYINNSRISQAVQKMNRNFAPSLLQITYTKFPSDLHNARWFNPWTTDKNKARSTERDAVKLLLQCRLVRNVMAFCSFTQGPGTNASQEEAPGTIGLPEEGAHTNKNWPANLKNRY